MSTLVTLTGVFPNNIQSTQNILITSNGGFGASPPGGQTATFTETGGGGEVATSTTFPFWSDTQIVCTVPTLTNAGDLGVTWALTFSATGIISTSLQVIPFVDSMLMTSITPNPQLSGQTLTLNGSGFGATQGTHFVAVGSPPTSFGETLAVNSWSDTLITVAAPTTFSAGFPPGVPNEVGIWTPGSFLFPAALHTNQYTNAEGSPTITAYIPSPTFVAQNQTLTIQGTGFNPTQDGTTVQFFTAGGIPVAPVITSWGQDNTGLATIKLTVPGSADLGTCHVTFTNGSFSVSTNPFTVEAPLVLPGGTVATQNQPVHITGVGFGSEGVGTTLIYFSASGFTEVVTATDWTNTSIYANIPADADFGPGFFFVIPAGETRAVAVFSGFTVQQGSAGPAASKFIPNVTWVTSSKRDGTYPIPSNSPFPVGQVSGINDPTHIQVSWLKPDGTYQGLNTPNADAAPLGALTSGTLVAIGALPPFPVL